MNNDIQHAINDLHDSVNELIQQNNKTINQIKMNQNNTVPLSANMETEATNEFDKFIRKGIQEWHTKSLNASYGENGGYLVPHDISLKIDDRIRYLSPMRSIAGSMSISTNSIEIIVDTKMPEAGWSADAEDDVLETDAPEISKIQVNTYELYAKPKASQKLLDDSQVNAEHWLVSKIAEQMAIVENDAFINGNGTDKPHGFLQYESSPASTRQFGTLQHFCSGAAGKFTDNETAVDVLIDMACSLQPQFVKNAKWIMSRSALAQIRKLKNRDGESLWHESLSEATPPTLLGYPVIIDDAMPELVEGEESVSVAFGDFYTGYQIVDRQGLNILRDPYTSKPFVEFYATKRTGGEVVNFDAIKLLKFAEE